MNTKVCLSCAEQLIAVAHKGEHPSGQPGPRPVASTFAHKCASVMLFVALIAGCGSARKEMSASDKPDAAASDIPGSDDGPQKQPTVEAAPPADSNALDAGTVSDGGIASDGIALDGMPPSKPDALSTPDASVDMLLPPPAPQTDAAVPDAMVQIDTLPPADSQPTVDADPDVDVLLPPPPPPPAPECASNTDCPDDGNVCTSVSCQAGKCVEGKYAYYSGDRVSCLRGGGATGFCDFGKCLIGCGQPGQVCCENQACQGTGVKCQGTPGSEKCVAPPACGVVEGAACCPTATPCSNGLSCGSDFRCENCGGPGEKCCTGGPTGAQCPGVRPKVCAPDPVKGFNTCQCGGLSQPCCDLDDGPGLLLGCNQPGLRCNTVATCVLNR